MVRRSNKPAKPGAAKHSEAPHAFAKPRAEKLPTSPPADGRPWRPTPTALARAHRKRVPDLIGPGLTVLFCGINPGRYSAAVGHHFAGPGNLFWGTLFAAGFTSQQFTAFDSTKLLGLGYGITNLVARTTATADELTAAELHRGARMLTQKAAKFEPRWVAVLGLQAFRVAFDQRKAVVGPQPEMLGPSKVWLLPNPSGLNAFHQPAVLTRMFSEFRAAIAAYAAPAQLG